ncbi:MAG: hypothetical protein K2J80_09220 [Oscillospiraceae bacterium]|nr:hypothetical protein [Oscillospiraceae bacterium]
MILTDFPFEFFCDSALFSEKWTELLSGLSGRRIVNIFGAWDDLDKEWFDDAPMLIEFAHGTLAVNVRSEKYLALAWNEIFPTEKPRWFGEAHPIPDWRENLYWREYLPLSQFKCAEILRVEAIEGENALNGLRFETDKGGFSIFDNGDVIAGIPSIKT